jgi:CHAD domain-containing protein
MLQHSVGAIFTDLTSGLEEIGFRVLRQRSIVEPLLFVDTQDGMIFARGGGLARCRLRGLARWCFGDGHASWIEGSSLSELRNHVAWLPAEAELHPVLHALRTGVALRLRGLATRDLTLVVESWSFSGPFATTDHHGEGAETPEAGAASAAGCAAPRPGARPPAPATGLPRDRAAYAMAPAAGDAPRPRARAHPAANGAAPSVAAVPAAAAATEPPPQAPLSASSAARPPRAAPAPVTALPPRWYLEPDDGPPHDRAYLNLVLAEHAAVFGCDRGRPAPRWDPLAAGLELLGRLPPGLPAPRALRLHRGDRLATLLSKVIRLQGLRLASCLDGVRYDRHPEYVHDARVATRRARFALRVAAANGQQPASELRDRLSMLARLIGPVRDLDVLIPRLDALARAARGDFPGNRGRVGGTRDAAQQRLAAALGARRAQRLARVQEGLPGSALAHLPELLSRWVDAGIFDRPVTPVAAAAIRTALAQAAKSGRAATRRSGARATDLHRLRLRLKRLRYTAELFAGALPRRRANRALATIVAQCATAQASLGELNDDAVAAAEIRAILPQLERHGEGPAVGGPSRLAQGILELLERRQRAAARRFGRRWPRLRKRLEDAVAEL